MRSVSNAADFCGSDTAPLLRKPLSYGLIPRERAVVGLGEQVRRPEIGERVMLPNA